MDTPTISKPRRIRFTLVVAVVATLFALYTARSFFIPLVAGVFLNLLLSPAVRGLRRRLRIPTPIGAVLVLVAFVGSLGYVAVELSAPTRSWIERLPRRWGQIERKVRRLKEPLTEIQNVGEEMAKVTDLNGPGRRRGRAPTPAPAPGPTIVESLISQGGALTVTLLVILLFTFLTLASSESFLQGVLRALPTLRQKKHVVSMVRLIESKVSRYLVTITVVNALLGLSVGLCLWAVGLPNPALWGTVAAILNFVPYAGALAGVFLVALASLLTFDSAVEIMTPPALYLGLTALEGYLLTPLALGRSLSLNPVVVFVGVFFWAWMWGVAGAILAVPIIIAAKIVCDNTEGLVPVGRVLGPGSAAESAA